MVPSLPRKHDGPLHLVIDSTGLKIVGGDQWNCDKHGDSKNRRQGRKLHLGIDLGGFIVVSALTGSAEDDGCVGVDLLGRLDAPVASFRDFDQDIADALGIEPPAATLLNDVMAGLIRPERLALQLSAKGLALDVGQAAALQARWWARYHAADRWLAQLRGKWDRLRSNGTKSRASKSRDHVIIVAPNGRRFRSGGTDARGVSRGGFASAVAAIWRSIEGVILDVTVDRLQLLPMETDIDTRFVLGTPGGLLYSAPEDQGEAAAWTVADTLQRALTYVLELPGDGASARADAYWT